MRGFRKKKCTFAAALGKTDKRIMRLQFGRFLFSLLLAGMLFQQASAQTVISSSSRNKKKEASPFASKLWYGAGLNIGFGSFNGSSQFGFGISPMVGYKIIEQISAGPRLSVFYTSTKLPGYKNLNLFDTELGIFLRGKVFRGFFLQGEVSNEWVQQPGDFVGNTISKDRFQRFNQYVGLGYNWGDGGWGSEISAFYNVAVANDIAGFENPWDYRFTITYRF
jgi:hypothetical protein